MIVLTLCGGVSVMVTECSRPVYPGLHDLAPAWSFMFLIGSFGLAEVARMKSPRTLQSQVLNSDSMTPYARLSGSGSEQSYMTVEERGAAHLRHWFPCI